MTTKLVYNNIWPKLFDENGVLDTTKLCSKIPSNYAIRLELKNVKKDVIIPPSIFDKCKDMFDIKMSNCKGRVTLDITELYGLIESNVEVDGNFMCKIKTTSTENTRKFIINVEFSCCENIMVDIVCKGELQSTITYVGDEVVSIVPNNTIETLETDGNVMINYEDNYCIRRIIIKNNRIGYDYTIGLYLSNFSITNSIVRDMTLEDNIRCIVGIVDCEVINPIRLETTRGNVFFNNTNDFEIIGERIDGLLCLMKCNNAKVFVNIVDNVSVTECKNLTMNGKILNL